MTGVGWVSHFYDALRICFHKTIYKRVRFLPFFFPPKIYMPSQGINIYIYIYQLVLNMQVLEILRTTSSPLLLLTNWVLLIN
jgi:hypothetical protein